MPPRESELWPIWCRGESWDANVAKCYLSRCQMCEHACHPSEAIRKVNAIAGVSTDKVRRWTFEPLAGRTVEVLYPFVFVLPS